MIKISDNNMDKNVLEAEYKRLLGYPFNYKLTGRSRELADWARHWYNEFGNPWVYSYYTNEINFSDNGLIIEGVKFDSIKFRNKLVKANADSAMLVIVSAGKELEQMSRKLWDEGKPDEYFFLEVYGSAVVEHLITSTGANYCEWAEKNNLGILPHYSPGYSGWNISDQVKLLNLIKNNIGEVLPGEIEVLDSGMLNPKKSLLAVFGITKNINDVQKHSELIPCTSCSLNQCQFRRTKYKHSKLQFENVQMMQLNSINNKKK